MSHLLGRAAVYRTEHFDDLEPYRYDSSIGAWVDPGSGELLVHSQSNNRPKPMTKKSDMETGEDQK